MEMLSTNKLRGDIAAQLFNILYYNTVDLVSWLRCGITMHHVLVKWWNLQVRDYVSEGNTNSHSLTVLKKSVLSAIGHAHVLCRGTWLVLVT